MATLIHPRMLDRLGRFFPLLATVQQKTTMQDQFGQPVETWSDLARHVAIPCARAPLSATERQALQMTVTEQVWTVVLRGHYPLITAAHRLVIDGQPYDILAAESDQTRTLTRLRVRRVSV